MGISDVFHAVTWRASGVGGDDVVLLEVMGREALPAWRWAARGVEYLEELARPGRWRHQGGFA